MTNTIGIQARLRAVLHEVPGIDEAFYSARTRAERSCRRATSTFSWSVPWTERLIEIEQDLDRDVNVTAYERAELDTLLESGDRFLRDVFDQPRVRLLPTEAAD